MASNPECEVHEYRMADGHCTCNHGVALGTANARLSEPAVEVPNTQQRIATIAAELGTVVAEKNAAYGSSFEKCDQFLRLLYPEGLHTDQYSDALLLVRIFDKCMRIATRKDAFGESPYRDLAGYGILGAAKDDQVKEWEAETL